MPITFVWRIRRSNTERILILGLFATGILASSASVVKLVIAMDASSALPTAATELKIDLCMGVELLLGLIAASLPVLKALVHRSLCSWGVLSPGSPACVPESFLDNVTNVSHLAHQVTNLSEPDTRALPGRLSPNAGMKSVTIKLLHTINADKGKTFVP